MVVYSRGDRNVCTTLVLKIFQNEYCLKLDFTLGRLFFKRIIDSACIKDLMVLAGFSRRDRSIKFFFSFLVQLDNIF